MECPSCSREVEPGLVECPWCGVVFRKWRQSQERPRPPLESPALPDRGADRARVRLVPVLLLGLLGAVLLIGAFWFVRIRPRIDLLEGGIFARAGAVSRRGGLELDHRSGLFDRTARLPIDPLGAAFSGREFLIAQRNAPGGFLRMRPAGPEKFELEHVAVRDPNYGQEIGFDFVAWNGREWVAQANGAWFNRSEDSLLVLIGPDDWKVRELQPAPPQLGCLAWDGERYWAATRKNTMDEPGEAWLYKLDRDFRVLDRYDPPGVGCQGMAWDGARLWFADVFNDTISLLDPSEETPRVVQTIATGVPYLSGLVWDGQRIWVTEYGDDRLLRLASTPVVAVSLPDDSAAGSSEAPAPAMKTASGDEVEELQRKLRSDHWSERMRAETRLKELGIPVGFDREQNSFAKRPDEDSEWIDWEAEVRGDSIEASWHLWFGPMLFEENTPPSGSIVTIPVFRRYTITIEGGTLPEPIERELEAIPGDNISRSAILASGLGPGSYEIDCFLHVQYVKRDGTNMILNRSAISLRVEK